jgi:hypothetical protein
MRLLMTWLIADSTDEVDMGLAGTSALPECGCHFGLFIAAIIGCQRHVDTLRRRRGCPGPDGRVSPPQVEDGAAMPETMRDRRVRPTMNGWHG